MSITDSEWPAGTHPGKPENFVGAKAIPFTPGIPVNAMRTKPRKPESVRGITREWKVVQGVGYQLDIPDLKISFTITRLRNRFDETTGLLTVRAHFPGAKTVADGMLASADFNLCNLRARIERAKYLAERAMAPELDWVSLIEEFCHRVLAEEESGKPEIPFENIPISEDYAAEITAAGLPLLRHHPTIWFGDGAAGKSLLALYAAIDLAQTGYRVLYCDWELDGDAHAFRLRRFVGPAPGLKDCLFYRRCDKPFIRDVNPIREIIARRNINFVVCDSIGFATDGAPESAEGATGYFRALRECGRIGSLHLAHINRSEESDKKPFGSIFWHAGARATWFIKRSEAEETDTVTVGLYNRKSNLGKLRPAFGLKIRFQNHETNVTPCDLAEVTELAAKMSFAEKLDESIRHDALTIKEILEEVGGKENSLRHRLDRNPSRFQKLNGGYGEVRYRLIVGGSSSNGD